MGKEYSIKYPFIFNKSEKELNTQNKIRYFYIYFWLLIFGLKHPQVTKKLISSHIFSHFQLINCIAAEEMLGNSKHLISVLLKQIFIRSFMNMQHLINFN